MCQHIKVTCQHVPSITNPTKCVVKFDGCRGIIALHRTSAHQQQHVAILPHRRTLVTAVRDRAEMRASERHACQV